MLGKYSLYSVHLTPNHWPYITQDILIHHCRKSKGVNNKTNDGWITFICIDFRVLVFCFLAHCHSLLGHLNRTEPSLMLLSTPMLFLLWQVQISTCHTVMENVFSKHGNILFIYQIIFTKLVSDFNLVFICKRFFFLSCITKCQYFTTIKVKWKTPCVTVPVQNLLCSSIKYFNNQHSSQTYNIKNTLQSTTSWGGIGGPIERFLALL